MTIDPKYRRALVVIGTRPEAVKLAPVVHALRDQGWHAEILATGQHSARMILDALHPFGLEPDHDIPHWPVPDLGRIVADTAEHVRRRTAESRGWVIVQGDTASAFGGALGAWHVRDRGIRLAHVEAGLRTMRLDDPYPEEGYRQMISRIAHLHCAPTGFAAHALRAEGIPAHRIHVTGNTVVDAMRIAHRRPVEGIDSGCVLVTLHRRGLPDPSLWAILEAAAAVCAKNSRQLVIVRHPRWIASSRRPHKNGSCIIEPQRYDALQWILDRAGCVLTDSGGLQEECAARGLPCLVARATTERPEACDAGVVRIVGTDPARVAEHLDQLLGALDHPYPASAAFGTGHAAEHIARLLGEWEENTKIAGA